MTRAARRLAVLALVLAAACGDKKPPPARPTAPAAAKAAAPAAAAPAPAPEAEVAYSSIGKRDPFKSFVGELRASTGAVVSRCSGPLGQFELDQLRLVAVVVGLADPFAMVEAPNGVGYTLKKGTCVGKNGGVVSTIRSGEVVVTEFATRADGSREKTDTVLRLPKKESLNLEE